MSIRRLFSLLTATALLLSACASATPTATVAPTAAQAPTTVAAATTAATAPTSIPTPANGLPFTHTACAAGVDLTGQTINFYHLLAQDESVDTYVAPLLSGYADASAYFNTHGGLCGATIKQVFPDTAKQYDPGNAYAGLLAQTPKPSLIILYSTSDAELLRDRLAKDQVAAVGFRVGSDAALYGYDGQTPGWIYSTNPRYGDQIGSMCDYVAAHRDRFPHPVIGFVGIADLPSISATFGPGHQYCAKLGIGDGGVATVSGNDTQAVQPALNRLIQSGANIIYTFAYDEAPSSMAHDLVHMGVQTTVTLAAYNWAFDPASAWPGALDTGADGLPVINGMLGSMPARSLAETDNPGIQLINTQADASKTPRKLRTNGYVKAWSTTDLLREVYVQTGNRVGYDHITGAEIKATLEKIVYATLGGVERIDFQGGALRTLTANRIGQLGYLGADGKTLAGPGNPPKNVSTNASLTVFVPMVIPLTDYQSAPDLRPGGPNVVATPAPTAAPVATGAAITLTGQLIFGDDSDGDIYRMNLDGSAKVDLTNNPAHDWGPSRSPDGTKIMFNSDRDGNPEIYVMNADGSGPTRLTNNPADDAPSGWSPDGKKIVFNTNRDGNYEVYVMNADGSGPMDLTNNPADDEWSAMSPDGKKIAFSSDRSGNGEIYLMNADGSGLVDLTNNPANDAAPFWSPDGKQIAFGSDRDGNGEIYLMNADGSGQTNLTHNAANDGDQAWSPDGKHIVFGSDRGGTNAIYVMNADGSDQILLPNSVPLNGVFWMPGAGASAPASTTGAGRIAYSEDTVSAGESFREIWIMNADGSGKTRLTNNAYYDGEPALSAGGAMLAYVSEQDGNRDIFVMQADGTHPVNLSKNPAQEGAPAWSPDNKKIVFVSDRDGNTQIYVMNADGSGLKRLTHSSASDGDPTWSPDGQHIVYLSSSNGNDDIWVMNADGSGQKNLTDDPVNDGGPAWSPDGKKIAFDTDRNGGEYDIYVMNADGSDQTRLTDNPANDYWAAWSPDGTAITFTSERDGPTQVYVMNADGSDPTARTTSANGAYWPSWAK